MESKSNKYDNEVIDRAIAGACERAMMRDMQWGVDDCTLWVCGIIDEATGRNPVVPFRGYASRFGAGRALKAYGGGGLVEAAIKAAAEAGFKPAGRPYGGNLVGIVMSPDRPSLAILWRGFWMARSQRGVASLPASAGVMAWRWA